LTGIEPGHPGLEGGEAVLGPRRALERLLAGLGEPAELLVGGRRAGADRVDLADQPGQPLPAVGRRALQAGHPPFLLRQRVLGRAPGADGLLERDAVLLDLALDRRLLLADLRRLGLERVRVAAGA